MIIISDIISTNRYFIYLKHNVVSLSIAKKWRKSIAIFTNFNEEGFKNVKNNDLQK